MIRQLYSRVIRLNNLKILLDQCKQPRQECKSKIMMQIFLKKEKLHLYIWLY